MGFEKMTSKKRPFKNITFEKIYCVHANAKLKRPFHVMDREASLLRENSFFFINCSEWESKLYLALVLVVYSLGDFRA